MPQPYLTWIRDPTDGSGFETVHLDGRRSSLLIGRRPGCSIPLPHDPTVSWDHAKLELVDGAWTITDVGSGAGTYVMRKRRQIPVTGEIALRHDDRLVLGRTFVRFANPDEPSTRVQTVLIDDEPENEAPSPRELEVLQALAEHRLDGRGRTASNKEIAHDLVVSPETVKSHIANLLRKFDAGSRHDLVELALRRGWVRRVDDDALRG